jgi:hypothetical protein
VFIDFKIVQKTLQILEETLYQRRYPLGGISRAERNFSLSFLISSTRETQDRANFRSARKIPPSGKRPSYSNVRDATLAYGGQKRPEYRLKKTNLQSIVVDFGTLFCF